MLMPPKGAEKLASKLDPPEYGTTSSERSLYPVFGGLTHRYFVLVAHLSNLRAFIGRFWICYRYRELVDVDGRPFRVPVSVQILVIGANGIFSQRLSQLDKCLYRCKTMWHATLALVQVIGKLTFSISYLDAY